MAPYKIVFVRHGESTWNSLNLFTGWTDVELSEAGKEEAKFAGQILKEKGFKFDFVYTSVLKRAVHTTWSILTELDQHYVPIINSWRLNERHYGALQGLNKAETAEKYGEQQVKIWRRSYDIQPPPLSPTDSRWSGFAPNYKSIPKDCCPLTECLKDTVQRVLPFWYDHIAPHILQGKSLLISAHGNSLRALIKHLDKMSDQEIVELNIPTAVPLVYELDENLVPIKHYYLMDEETVKAKISAVANQAKATKA